MRFISIRGATTASSNSEKEIINRTEELIKKIEDENGIEKEDVISITFSATRDLNKAYPARAARSLGYTNSALMCFQEMYVEGSLPMCIRLKLDCLSSDKKQKDVKHVYLREARFLRPDLGGQIND